MNWDDCLTRSKRVAARTIGSETFIVSPAESMLHLLPNEVATRIWDLADGSHTLGQIHQQICQEFDVDAALAEIDLRDFVDALVAKELAHIGPCPRPPADGGV